MQPNNKKPKEAFNITQELKKPTLHYEDLEAFSDDFDFINMIAVLREKIFDKNTDWETHVGIINTLRRLQKHEQATFNNTFYNLLFHEKILEHLNSYRSVLAKVALTFLGEIFSEYQSEYDNSHRKASIIKYVWMCVPTLIVKANCTQNFIKKEATDVLGIIINNMFYGETLCILLNSVLSKKNEECNLACDLAIQFMRNIGGIYYDFHNTFEGAVKYMAKIADTKKEPYLKKASCLLSEFINIVGEENFNDKIKYCKLSVQNTVNSILEYEKKKQEKSNTDKDGVKKFIKESKAKFRNSCRNRRSNSEREISRLVCEARNRNVGQTNLRTVNNQEKTNINLSLQQ